MTLQIATKTKRCPELVALPPSAVTETFAFLARRGAGKTYCAGVLAEEFLDLGAQVVILDPVDKWWGLRLGADGKTPGYAIPVFGGAHGDVPLAPTSGALMAQLVVERGISVVLSLTRFQSDAEQRRFVTDFCKTLYRLKQAQEPPTPLHLIFEEAEEFLPQDMLGEQAQMVHAVKRILKLGRNYGIGASLVSQRSADINKKGLSQVGTLVAMHTTSPHDRKAIKGWMHGAGVTGDEDLGALQVGEAYLWAPWDHLMVKMQFRKKRTFDSSATPKLTARKKVEVTPLSAAELDKLKGAIAATVEQHQANDPAALRKQIRALEKELSARRPAPTLPEPAVMKEALERAHTEGRFAGAGAATQDLLALDVRIEALLGALTEIGKQAKAAIDRDAVTGIRSTPAARAVRAARDSRPSNGHAATPPTWDAVERTRARRPAVTPTHVAGATVFDGQVKIKAGARKMLAALATSPTGTLTRAQLGALVQMKITGGTFGDYLSKLRTGRLATTSGDGVTITDNGRAFLGNDLPDIPQTTAEVLALWAPKLKAGARKMLDHLVGAYPEPLSREQLADRVEMVPTGGTFGDYLSKLCTAGLAERVDGGVRASDNVFPQGAPR